MILIRNDNMISDVISIWYEFVGLKVLLYKFCFWNYYWIFQVKPKDKNDKRERERYEFVGNREVNLGKFSLCSA